jgi:hypothetical protein
MLATTALVQHIHPSSSLLERVSGPILVLGKKKIALLEHTILTQLSQAALSALPVTIVIPQVWQLLLIALSDITALLELFLTHLTLAPRPLMELRPTFRFQVSVSLALLEDIALELANLVIQVTVRPVTTV